MTDAEGHPTAKLGDTEWQFSDGPPGSRGSSWDFLSLEEGLREMSPALYYFFPLEQFSVKRLPDGKGFQVVDNHHGSWVDGVFCSASNAQAFAEILADIEERASGMSCAQKMKTVTSYFVGKGAMSDDQDVLALYRERYGIDCKAGDPEWQFSNGPIGQRGRSSDFPTLESGLAELCPAYIFWEDG